MVEDEDDEGEPPSPDVNSRSFTLEFKDGRKVDRVSDWKLYCDGEDRTKIAAIVVDSSGEEELVLWDFNREGDVVVIKGEGEEEEDEEEDEEDDELEEVKSRKLGAKKGCELEVAGKRGIAVVWSKEGGEMNFFDVEDEEEDDDDEEDEEEDVGN